MMKNRTLYISVIAALAMLSSCSNNDEYIYNTYETDPNAVHFTASIGDETRVGTLENDDKWEVDDMIHIASVNGIAYKNEAIYKYKDSSWKLQDDKYIVWVESATNTFQAYYPFKDGVTYDSFTLPSNQSSNVKGDANYIGNAEWLTASAEVTTPTFSGSVNLSVNLKFSRKVALIEFDVKLPTGINQYVNQLDLSNLLVNLPSGYSNKNTGISLEKDEKKNIITTITPYNNSNEKIYAIVPPCSYSSGATFLSFTVNGEDNLSVNTAAEYSFEAGKKYTFTLDIGKDVVSISSVSVSSWEDGTTWEDNSDDNAGTEDDVVVVINNTMTTNNIYNAIVTAAGEKVNSVSESKGIKLSIKGECKDNGTLSNALKQYFSDNNNGAVATYTNVSRLDLTGITKFSDINGYIFSNNQTLIEVLFPDCITTIQSYLFCDDISLVYVKLPKDLTTLKVYIFAKCTSLQTIELPKNLTFIGQNSFQSCTSLTKIVIPNNVTTINRTTFCGCTNLTSVKLSENAEYTTINSELFKNCTSLKEIEIPANITEINYSAFESCKNLASVTCRATTPPTLGERVFKGIAPGAILYVPSESVSAYQSSVDVTDENNKTSYGWTTFFTAENIKAIPGTEVTEDTSSDTTTSESD